MVVVPAPLAVLDLIERKQIEAPAGFLILAQDQAVAAPPPPAIGFDRDRFNVEKDQDAIRRQVLKYPTNTG
jgi:hypothetical protein